MIKKIFQKQFPFAILVLIILGAFLRIYKLSFQSYWLDEARSILLLLSDYFFQALKSGFSGDPPLCEFILYFWIKLFGHSEVSTRIFSSIFSIATLPLMYLAVKEFFDNKTAIFSTLLLSFSAYHIYYAQEARMYAFSWFFVVASTLFFIKLIKKSTKRNWIIYLITTVLAFYAYYSSLFVLLTQNVFVFMFWKRRGIKLKHWIGMQLVLIMLFLPWVCISVMPRLIIPTFIKKTETFWITPPSYRIIFETFIYFIWGHDWIIGKYVGKYLFFCKVFLFLIGGMIFLSIYTTFRQKESSQKKEVIFFMLLWCFSPIIIVYLVSIYIKPFYLVRYVSLALFPAYILVAYSLSKISIKLLKFLVLAIFLIPNMFALYQYYNFPVKGEAREIAQYIKSKKTLYDTVLVRDLNGGADAIRYYYPDIYSVNFFSADPLKEIMKKKDDFWLLLPSHYGESPYKILKDNGGGEDFFNRYYLSEKMELRTTNAFYFKRRDYNVQ